MKFLSIVFIATIVTYTRAQVPQTPLNRQKEVSPEGMRDVLFSLIHMFRVSEDKLERHEFREKALGEQLKKALANLDKQHKSLEPLKGAISRLDERLSNVETILLGKDEQEKQQLQKTNEIIDTLQTTLNTWSASISNMVRSEIGAIKLPTNDIESKIKNLEDGLNKKINDVMKSVEDVRHVVAFPKKETPNCKEQNVDETVFIKHFGETEKLLTKYDSKLMEYHVNISKINAEPDPYGDILSADEAWHNKMTIALENQQTHLRDIQTSLQNLETIVKDIPNKNNVDNFNNLTLKEIQESRYDIISNSDRGIMKLSSEVNNMKRHNEQSQESLMKEITKSETETKNIYSEVIKNYDQLKIEIQSLSKGERVMIQTADNVLDTKRRIEYGIHQILLEVGDLIKAQSKDLNTTVNQRFDDIETSIVDSQSGALTNLTSKIEHEISQVWRQIGIMYQQVTASNTALDRLQAQTEQYVNGSVTTMDSMEGKVGMITSRMTEVDENLNYLLGRLSLVTQEFNRIKIGLGDALDNIKNSFLIVQSKIKEAGPGPHKIPSGEEDGSNKQN